MWLNKNTSANRCMGLAGDGCSCLRWRLAPPRHRWMVSALVLEEDDEVVLLIAEEMVEPTSVTSVNHRYSSVRLTTGVHVHLHEKPEQVYSRKNLFMRSTEANFMTGCFSKHHRWQCLLDQPFNLYTSAAPY